MQSAVILGSIVSGLAGLGVGFALSRLITLRRETQLHLENNLLRTQTEELKSTEALLRMEINDLSLSNTRLETLLEEASKLNERQQEQFELISRKTLKAIAEELEEKAAKEHQQKQGLLDERLNNLLKPLKELIEQNDKKVQELEKQHAEDTASLKTHIEMIVGETAKLVNVKNKLAEALSNSKGRGDWGEMELIRLLEASGLIEGVHYEAQRVENGLRPDITIRLSNQRILYIDAKTILVNLERLMGAGDSEEEAQERKKHAAALEKEILSLSLKSYEAQCKDSIDFVILYVPRESMLRVALEEKPLLLEQAFQRRVILASPLILMAILKTVAYGWEQAQLSKKAQEIQVLGRELHKRACIFVERFLKVGDRIEALSSSFEDARTSLEGRQGILPQLRKFEEYGCKSEKQLPAASFTEATDETILTHAEAVPNMVESSQLTSVSTLESPAKPRSRKTRKQSQGETQVPEPV
ncbi:MAG TPA: DNA recombination protein RmuC [Oculatellaceae cyanobacterium]